MAGGDRYCLTYLLLEEYYGTAVATVSEQLKWGPKSFKLLATNLTLPMSTIKQALITLIKFNFVAFKPSILNNNRCEYSLLTDNILQLIRHPKFILIIRTKYGTEAEFIIRELLYNGKLTLYNLICKVTRNLLREHPDIPYSLDTIKNTVCDLIADDFVMAVDRVSGGGFVPIPIKLTEAEKLPRIDMKKLQTLYDKQEYDAPTNDLNWKVNTERFLVEMRNEMMISAISRRFGPEEESRSDLSRMCSIIMRNLLKLSFTKNDPWRPVSNPVPMMLLRESVANDPNVGSAALQYIQQFIDVMEDDSSSFIGKSPHYRGGTVVCFKDAFYSITIDCLHLIISQKFGPNAGRIFNIIRDKKYVELEQIQRIAMLAVKEANNITLKLQAENFIQMQELRKPTAGLGAASASNKTFQLFYVDLPAVIKVIVDTAYQNINRITIRLKEEMSKNSLIIAKKEQADLVRKELQAQHVGEESIQDMISDIISPPEMAMWETSQKVIKRLQMARLQIDETILLLQLYIQYNKTWAPESKLKKRK